MKKENLNKAKKAFYKYTLVQIDWYEESQERAAANYYEKLGKKALKTKDINSLKKIIKSDDDNFYDSDYAKESTLNH